MNKKYPIAFVFIVEYGDLEVKSTLLAESLRKFFPDNSRYPIYAVRPRKGKEISRETLNKFEDLHVTYIYKPINVLWKDLPFANEAYGSAIAEELLKDDANELVYIDSDVVLLKYPEQLLMPDNIKLLITPVDVSDSDAVKVGENVPDNWKFCYKLMNVDSKDLWTLHTKIDNIEIYPYFNSGLIVVRPEIGIFRGWREMFDISVKNGYFGIVNPFSKSFFFTDQLFLSTVIVSILKKDEIIILDNGYNFPLNYASQIFSKSGKIEINNITFLHYHHSFYDMEWEKFINFNNTEGSWLISRLPLHKDLNTARYRKKIEYIRQYLRFCFWRIKFKFNRNNILLKEV